MSYILIKYYYDMGVYSLEQVMEHVKQKDITEEEFHSITARNYQGNQKPEER